MKSEQARNASSEESNFVHATQFLASYFLVSLLHVTLNSFSVVLTRVRKWREKRGVIKV